MIPYFILLTPILFLSIRCMKNPLIKDFLIRNLKFSFIFRMLKFLALPFMVMALINFIRPDLDSGIGVASFIFAIFLMTFEVFQTVFILVLLIRKRRQLNDQVFSNKIFPLIAGLDPLNKGILSSSVLFFVRRFLISCCLVINYRYPTQTIIILLINSGFAFYYKATILEYNDR